MADKQKYTALGGGYVSIPIVDKMYKIHFAHNAMHKVTKDMNLTV